MCIAGAGGFEEALSILAADQHGSRLEGAMM